MKKVLILSLIIMSTAFAQVKVQAQVGTLGTGLGLGVGMKVIPVLLDAGLELQTCSMPGIQDKGKVDVDGVETAYDGEYTYSGTNIGGYLQFHIPAINFIPVVNILANPIIHFGSIEGRVAVEGTVSALGQAGVVADDTTVKGSYLRLGLPFYIGPVFIEPSFGSQKLAVQKVGQYENVPDAQIAIGLQFF